jgi:hypothetical protein
MAEPIANDWKAIHNRMQQITAEKSAYFRACRECNGLGWIPKFSDHQHSQAVGYTHCGLCHNLGGLPPPRHAAGR